MSEQVEEKIKKELFEYMPGILLISLCLIVLLSILLHCFANTPVNNNLSRFGGGMTIVAIWLQIRLKKIDWIMNPFVLTNKPLLEHYQNKYGRYYKFYSFLSAFIVAVGTFLWAYSDAIFDVAFFVRASVSLISHLAYLI